ncbi:hypothetical protein L211DRAFT_891357 [Terfezia boudieri ATCC MYA-4762]|uniref:Uncharacterized protein n=1 Tax=Terfezia boudieri ATCC MYA-4762 TaxID=1051890 RepID=A0A3N4M3J1_9PEZI|nr:hypothetical protein L211DRAFT_891357 [Terfezia boudieri ATCC MYA-4762]
MESSQITHGIEGLKPGPPASADDTKPRIPTFDFHHRNSTSSPPSTLRIILGVLFLLAVWVYGFTYLSTGQDVQLREFFTCTVGSESNYKPTARSNRQNAYGGSEPDGDVDPENPEVIMSCIPQSQLEMLEHKLASVSEAIVVERKKVVELEAELEGYRPSYKKKRQDV